MYTFSFCKPDYFIIDTNYSELYEMVQLTKKELVNLLQHFLKQQYHKKFTAVIYFEAE